MTNGTSYHQVKTFCDCQLAHDTRISHQVKTAIGDKLYISVNNTKLHSMQEVEEHKEHWAAGQVYGTCTSI